LAFRTPEKREEKRKMWLPVSIGAEVLLLLSELLVQGNTNREITRTGIPSTNGIRTKDSSVLPDENSSCLRPHAYCDRGRIHFDISHNKIGCIIVDGCVLFIHFWTMNQNCDLHAVRIRNYEQLYRQYKMTKSPLRG
jgi:hypothetical protein